MATEITRLRPHDAPFILDEAMGPFRFNERFYSRLKKGGISRLIHTTHRPEARRIIRNNRVSLRSHFDIEVDGEQSPPTECVWAGIQAWDKMCQFYNRYGPYSFEFSLDCLLGRRFFVLKRKQARWTHYFFVEREDKTPVFGDDNAFEAIDPVTLFDKIGTNGLTERSYVNYEFVLTTRPSMSKFLELRCHPHDECKNNECRRRIERSEAKLDLRKDIDRMKQQIERMAGLSPANKSGQSKHI